ncbi:MAG: hypothetical protein LBV59_00440 [Sphingobacterium sp.]|uniref:hypothetical protein n=1 Tax=Sphingobacterium sp. TaxID=341027 RepID=UPI00284F9A3B|nr:hypothetical protein [Sphingobacterium sp.]MDR3006367.1 hypothetical protein [Sphingobacterium sp.]
MNGKNQIKRIRVPARCAWLFVGMWMTISVSQAQVCVSGKVTSAGKPLGSVRVDLCSADSSGLIQYTFTNQFGQYRFDGIQLDQIVLRFKALSYNTLNEPVLLKKTDTILNVELSAGGVERLQEVLVHAKRPYRLGRDTIELQTSSFLQGDERTVEDLLRKIPGLSVGNDGIIKIGDKEVEKVMVEGDDLFGKGYRLLTQNMSVQPLEKVQILQRYSNNKHLKGIENSDKVALNLSLKADSKSQWIGSATISGTPVGKQYYSGSINVMNFGKKNKYYLLSSANNNGVDAVSSINHLLYSGQTDEAGQIGAEVTTPTIIDNSLELPGFDYRRTNFNRDMLHSFNMILNPLEHLKVKWLGFVNLTKKSFYRNTIQTYHVEDISFTNRENNEFSKEANNYFSKWELHYDIDKRSTLVYTGNLGSLQRNDNGSILFNDVASKELTWGKGVLTNHNITHTFKVSPSAALVSSARWILQRSPLDYGLDQYYYEDLFQTKDVANVTQHIENDLQYLGITSQYVKKSIQGDYLELALSNEYKDQKLLTNLFLHTNDGQVLSPNGFNNYLHLRSNNSSILAKYTIKRKKWELTPQLRAGFAASRWGDLSTENQKNYLQFSPSLSSRWSMYHKGKLEATFSLRQNNSELTDIVPNYYTIGIRNFVKGLDNIALLTNYGGVISYTHGNLLDRFFGSLSLGHHTFSNYISTSSLINPNFTINRQIVLKNKKSSFFKAQLNYYLKPLNGNLKFDVEGRYSSYETAVEGLGIRQVHTDSYDYGLSFRSVWRSRLNIYGGYRIESKSYTVENKMQLKNTYGFLQLFLNMGTGIQANLKNESYRFGDFMGSKSKAYYFSDFSISYDVKKIKTRFDITAKNIFNNRTFQQALLTDTYQAITSYQLLPRYVSFGIDYSF